ncbi:MAG: TetR family transcriptional regulator [Ponticaulis sp.]|nr:TetR family transcriptional regulator [Ponticaulis sp.]|tara:strand:+ start:85832 stop:86527 length:696 start_codon:yes stop_codon:yes gene_type:complete
MTGQETRTKKRELILDAAEALFSRHGYDGVTLRAIAKMADVDVALANYYFGPKRDLFEAVFMRRAKVLNSWRLEALEAVIEEAQPNAPSVRCIIEAYFAPLLTRSHVHDEGWKNYYALIGYVNSSHEWGGQLMSQQFDPLIDRFLEALKMAIPDVSEENLYWAYHCLSGALTLALAQTGRIDHLSNGLCRSDDLSGAHSHIVNFITAGFEQLKDMPEKKKTATPGDAAAPV